MRTPDLADQPESWPVVASADLYRSDWVMALRSDTLHPPGREDETFDRLVLEHPGAVIVLALDDDDRVFCLRQYRHPVQMRFVELPAGLCDGEEPEEPEEVARRELVEEAGLEAGEWTYLTTTYSSPGIIAEAMHFFLARDLRPADRGEFEARHEEADMETFWVPFPDLLAAVLAGRVGDAPLVLAVLLAHARGLRAAGAAGR